MCNNAFLYICVYMYIHIYAYICVQLSTLTEILLGSVVHCLLCVGGDLQK